MARTPWAVLGVPIDSVGAPAGGPPFGTEEAPGVLRALGLVDRLKAQDLGDLSVRITGPGRDKATGLKGGDTVARAVAGIRAGTEAALRDGHRPFLLGGCCAVLMGAVPAARDAFGSVGLAYLDGHIDIYDQRTSPTGEAADMPVGFLLGRGEPGVLAQMTPLPSLDIQALLVLGARDEDEASDVGELAVRLGIRNVEPDTLTTDPSGSGHAAANVAGAPGSFWMHLDVDILSIKAFPATDYLMPGGISMQTLVEVMRPLGADPRLVGVSIACYNPSKDPGRVSGALLVDALAAAFGS